MSLIWIRKNSGPRTVPWGTPDRTLLGLEMQPSTTTNCWRFFRKEVIQSRRGPWIPALLIFERRRLWSTLSKAFEKSKSTASVWAEELRKLVKSLRVVRIWDSHDLFWRKPCWKEVKKFWRSRKSEVVLKTICSRSLQGMQVSEIGLWFSGEVLSPFLKRGKIWAVFQSSGTVPRSRDCWNNITKISWSSNAQIFNSLPGMSSGPVAFLSLNFPLV